jgi:hypothetical protein
LIISRSWAGLDTTRCLSIGWGAARKFLHELLVLSVNGITSANAASGRARSSARTIVAPISTTLSIGAISSHVTCISTDATDDVGREVALFRAVVFSVTNLTTVLASLILIVSKSTIECCKLTKLVTLELVLAFWDRGSSLNDVVDQLLRLVDLLLSICHDQAV